MWYISLGIKNLLKHRRRSLLTIMTVAIGLGSLLLAKGFMNYSLEGLRESIVHGGTGHYQISRKGFSAKSDEDSYGYLMTDYAKTIRELSEISGIACVAPRLSFSGLLSSENQSTVVMGWGGVPDKEKALTGLSSIAKGRFLGEDEPYGMIVGKGVAEIAGLEVGGDAVLSIAMKDGAVNATDFTLAGIIGNQLEQMESIFVSVPLASAQRLMNVGDSIDTLVVLLSDTDDMKTIEPVIASFCEKSGLSFLRWDQIIPYYEGAREFYSSAMNIAIVVIFAILIFSIANTMSMIVFDRMREIGTIRSLGTSAKRVFAMMECESFLMAVAGCALGLALALFLAWANNASGGITLPPPPGNSKSYQGMIFLSTLDVAWYTVNVIFVSLLASVYPTIKAVRMSIADTLRWL